MMSPAVGWACGFAPAGVALSVMLMYGASKSPVLSLVIAAGVLWGSYLAARARASRFALSADARTAPYVTAWIIALAAAAAVALLLFDGLAADASANIGPTQQIVVQTVARIALTIAVFGATGGGVTIARLSADGGRVKPGAMLLGGAAWALAWLVGAIVMVIGVAYGGHFAGELFKPAELAGIAAGSAAAGAVAGLAVGALGEGALRALVHARP